LAFRSFFLRFFRFVLRIVRAVRDVAALDPAFGTDPPTALQLVAEVFEVLWVSEWHDLKKKPAPILRGRGCLQPLANRRLIGAR
jgi:hypothetical protein